MSCPCECCKETRRQKREARALARQASIKVVDPRDMLSPMEKNHLRIGAHVVAATLEHIDDTWTSQDGRTVRLQGMGISHLYYAAAKMAREGRTAPQHKLESEILRRLSKAYYPQSYRDPNEAGNYRDRETPLPMPNLFELDQEYHNRLHEGTL